MNANHRSVIAKYWQYISLGAVIALAVALSVRHDLTQAQSLDENDSQRTLSIPLGSTGLTYGEGIRATLTNLGNRRVAAQIRILDAEGVVLKQEPLEVEPSQMRSVTMGRGEVGRSELSALVRAEAVVAQMDAPHLWLTSEVINWSTGRTQFMAMTGPVYGSNLQHNETMALDRQ
jgi:hypothetical protein